MTLALIGKSVLIATIASLSAWLYLAGLGQLKGVEIATRGYLGVMLYGSLIGSFGLGLPIALLVFWLSHKHLMNSPATLAMISLLAGIMMMLASYVIGQDQGIVMLGIPAFCAAVTFGVLGWFWIIKPMGKAASD